MKPRSENESLDENEIARRRDAALLKALSTPHKKQADMRVGKRGTERRARASGPKSGKAEEPA